MISQRSSCETLAVCAACVLGLVLVAGACDSGSASGDGERLPNIYLITIDTLRPDHMSLYGYHKKTTPFLDSIGSRGVRFDQAYATSSWTLPSIVSMLSGLDPSAHGVNQAYVDPSGLVAFQDALPPDRDWLPEMLRRRGYQTLGLTANSHLAASHGFARGFDFYECLGFARAAEVNARVAELADGIAAAEPRFVWIHYFDPHGPYSELGLAQMTELEHRRTMDPALIDQLDQLLLPEQFYDAGVLEDPRVLEHLVSLYDGEIYSVDRSVEELFGLLDVSDDDLVIVAADHGEEFLDHGDLWHGHTLYEELLRVPLIIRFPGPDVAGTVDDAVTLTDLLPTLLEYLGADSPRVLQGHSLLPLVDGQHLPPRPIHASLELDGPMESVTFDGWKYVHHASEPEADQLFNLVADRRETDNLVASHPEKAEELRRILATLLSEGQAQRTEVPPLPLTDDQVRQLRAVGYLK